MGKQANTKPRKRAYGCNNSVRTSHRIAECNKDQRKDVRIHDQRLAILFVASPARLHALVHLRDVTGRHAGKGIERRFVFLLAVADKLVIRGAN